MLIGTILPSVSLITQIFYILDLTSKLGFSSIALQYGSIISQISPASILDWILTFADIAGVAAIGLVVVVVYFQSRQRKFAGLIEIFKLLNGKEHVKLEQCCLKHIENTRRPAMILFLMMNSIWST
jgi:hypothetical protein